MTNRTELKRLVSSSQPNTLSCFRVKAQFVQSCPFWPSSANRNRRPFPPCSAVMSHPFLSFLSLPGLGERWSLLPDEHVPPYQPPSESKQWYVYRDACQYPEECRLPLHWMPTPHWVFVFVHKHPQKTSMCCNSGWQVVWQTLLC